VVKTAETCRDEGDNALTHGDDCGAEQACTRGLAVCADSNASLARALYCNRSFGRFRLERFQLAYEDACAAIMPESNMPDQATAVQVRALLGAGSAAYALARYETALAHLMRATDLPVTPVIKAQAQTLLIKIISRLYKQNTADYDFAEMQATLEQNQVRLDHASNLKNTENPLSAGRGRGLFAVEEILAGDLVLCEKAFGAVVPNDVTGRNLQLIDIRTGMDCEESHSALLSRLPGKLQDNPDRKFFSLHSGNCGTAGLRDVDDKPLVDALESKTS
jgi:hypothetical protein